MKTENLIVTAFFDIGRGIEKDEGLTRSNMQYLEYFKGWARLKNEMVIYTMPQFSAEVRSIREQFGLGDNTHVIEIEDVYEIEPHIYQRMKQISEENVSQQMKLHVNALSGKAKYDYIMMLKYYFMASAVEYLDKKDGNVSWIDFGFNHGFECYTDEKDFDFEWCPDLRDNIHLFSLREPEDVNGLGSLLLQLDCIMGAPVVSAVNKSVVLWNYCREAMMSLISLDTIDDDQQLLLMSYKRHPEDFCIHPSEWFLPIKQFGGEHMKVREYVAGRKMSILKVTIRRTLSTVKAIVLDRYVRPQPLDYGKRMQKYCSKMLLKEENKF